MSLIMTINDGDFVMLCADRTAHPIEDSGLHYTSTSKIIPTSFGLLATFGDEDLAISTRARIREAAVVDPDRINDLIVEERNEFCKRFPELKDEMICSGAVVAFSSVDLEGNQTYLHTRVLEHAFEPDQLSDDLGEWFYYCGNFKHNKKIQGFMDAFHRGAEKLRAKSSRAERIRRCAKLMTNIHKEISRLTPSMSIKCDIAVQLDDNSAWECKKIDGEFRLIDF